MRIYLILLALSLPNIAQAIDAYKCTIDYTAGLHDSGEIAPTSFSKLLQSKEFVVDKGTGRITGGVSNHSASGQPQVLDYGSDVQSFKVLTIFKPNTTVSYLYIKEFSDNQEKPFIFISASNVFSGKCVAY